MNILLDNQDIQVAIMKHIEATGIKLDKVKVKIIFTCKGFRKGDNKTVTALVTLTGEEDNVLSLGNQEAVTVTADDIDKLEI
jgi:hypothetical protein